MSISAVEWTTIGFKTSTIMNVEVSSLCNDNCRYCPSLVLSQHRSVGLMNIDIFNKSMDWVKYFGEKGTQTELNLFGVGESTLNPNLVEMVKIARKALPPHLPLYTNTNGKTMTDDLAKQLKEAGITRVNVTGHDVTTAIAIEILKKYEIFGSQVDCCLKTNYTGIRPWLGICPWLGKGQIMVMWNGDITRCYLDSFGEGIMGNIYGDIKNIFVTPFGSCKTCRYDKPKVRVVIQEGGALR